MIAGGPSRRTGADCTPAMIAEPVRTTSPAGSIARPAGEQLLEQDAALQAGERGADAEVRAEAERDVGVRVAVDVEAGRPSVRTRPRPGWPRRRAAGAGRRRGSATPRSSVSTSGGAHERDDRRGPAQQLLDRRRDERRVGDEPRPLRRGWWRAPTDRPEIMLRVVSLPATSSWLRNMTSSSSVSTSPSTSTLARTEMRSSPVAAPARGLRQRRAGTRASRPCSAMRSLEASGPPRRGCRRRTSSTNRSRSSARGRPAGRR